MCGIAGIRRRDGEPVAAAELSRMSDTLAHRGPDGSGVHTAGTWGFAHRRLSIVDLAGSPQPMQSPDGRFTVTFNGEILNYRELRARWPFPYRTSGDTEVLLAGFACRGRAALGDLVGQFAFALHDADTDTLVLARDPRGILPLYYYLDDRVLLFASEIKALLPVLPTPPVVDLDSVADYLGARSVPGSHTLWRGIRKLPAGHLLRLGPTGEPEVLSYAALADSAAEDPDMTAEQAVAGLDRALRAAVGRNLVADVPVGAFLSGGLDSSVLVALASQLRGDGQRLATFSAGFGDDRHDELPWARRVASLLGTDHHEVSVRPDDVATLWERLTWHRDAPVSEASDIAVFRLAELARTEVKVALSGEGSDELFGGYPKHRLAGLTAAAGRAPAWLRTPAARQLERALPASAARARIAVRALGAPDAEARIAGWFASFTPGERTAMLRGPWPGRGPEPLPLSGDPLRQMLGADLVGWLADNLLERADRMSMAASLETRPPFLDPEVVRHGLAMPSRWKVGPGRGPAATTKWAVKQLGAQLLPAEVVHRPKVGFRVPLDVWFRGSLADLAADRLLSSEAFVPSILDRRAVAALLASHRSGRRDEHLRIWTLLGLEIWHSVFFRSASPQRPPAPTLVMPAAGLAASA